MRSESQSLAILWFIGILVILLGGAVIYSNYSKSLNDTGDAAGQDQYQVPGGQLTPEEPEPTPEPEPETPGGPGPTPKPEPTPEPEPEPEPPTPEPPQPPEPETPPTIEKYPKKKWTTLFYVAYDNSIGPIGIWESDRHFLELIGTDDNINLVALVDQEEFGDGHVLIIGEGNSTEYPPSVIEPTWGDELNTGTPDVLFEFLKWGVSTFPAEYYDFHIMDHGAGWLGACIDESDNNSIIRGHEFAEVYSDISKIIGKKIDIVSYDACFMGSFEFGWEICDSVHYLTGMQTIAAGDDDQEYIIGNFEVYETWQGLKDNPDWTPEEFAVHQVNSFYKVGPYLMPSLGQTHLYSSDTMSTSDLTKMANLKDSFSKFAEELYESVIGGNEVLAERQLILEVLGPSTGTPETTTESFTAQSDFIGLGIYYLYDLGDFVERLIEYGDQLCGKETAQEFLEAFSELVVECTHGDNAMLGEHPDAHGLDIYFPYRNGKYDNRYDETALAQDTLWDDFLKEVPWTS